MARDPNCSLISDQLPLSSEIFQVIKAQIWIFLIPVFLGLVQVGLFLEQTGFFLRHGKSSHRTSVLLWILGVYPVFSLTSLICLYIPRASFVCNFVASIFAFCMKLSQALGSKGMDPETKGEFVAQKRSHNKKSSTGEGKVKGSTLLQEQSKPEKYPQPSSPETKLS